VLSDDGQRLMVEHLEDTDATGELPSTIRTHALGSCCRLARIGSAARGNTIIGISVDQSRKRSAPSRVIGVALGAAAVDGAMSGSFNVVRRVPQPDAVGADRLGHGSDQGGLNAGCIG
jgi:hypothetical protein